MKPSSQCMNSNTGSNTLVPFTCIRYKHFGSSLASSPYFVSIYFKQIIASIAHYFSFPVGTLCSIDSSIHCQNPHGVYRGVDNLHTFPVTDTKEYGIWLGRHEERGAIARCYPYTSAVERVCYLHWFLVWSKTI